MNRLTFPSRLIDATASIVVRFGLFPSIAALGDFDRPGAAPVAQATTVTSKVSS